LGNQQSAEIEDNAEWRASAHAQQQVPRDALIDTIKQILA